MRRETEAGQVAKMLRKDLKAAFPEVTFKVTSKTYTGGNSITVRWMDGPTINPVQQITHKYLAGSFDSMQDLYVYSHSEGPDVNYIHCDRDASPAVLQALVDEVNQRDGSHLKMVKDDSHAWISSDGDFHNGRGWQQQEPYRLFQDRSY